MNVPFFDLKRQYAALRAEIEPAVLAVMGSCGYVGGKTVEDFERKLAGYVGAGYAVACGNGTEALVLALRACGVRPGDEVITTPFTFFATAEAVASIGARPVFADICLDDFNLDPSKIEDHITEKTRAILPVHLFGAPCDMDAIMDIAHRHGLKVIEDAAQAIGCQYRGKRIGSTADISCFSFYPTKNLGGMGDGGIVTTDDENLALILRSLREHGAGKRGAEARALLDGGKAEEITVQETGAGYDPYKYWNSLIGYNSRLDAMQAAALSVKLDHLDAFNAARAEIADYYGKHLCAQAVKPSARPEGKHCWHQYVIRCDRREELIDYLSQKEIGTIIHYPIPPHLSEAYSYLGHKKGDFPITERYADTVLSIPMYTGMTKEEQDYVIGAVNAFA